MDGHRDTLVPSDVRSCVVSRRCKMSKWSEWRIDNECIIPSSSASSTTKNTFSSSQIHGRRGSHIPTQVKDNKDTKKDQKGFWAGNDKKKNDDGFSTSMIRMIRTRHVERLPQGMGRPCPHLKEYKQGHEIEEIMRKDNNRNILFSSFTDTNNGRINTNSKRIQQHQQPYMHNLDMNRKSTNRNRQGNEDDVNRQPPPTITSTRCKNR